MHNHHDDDDDRNQNLVNESRIQRTERLIDQPGSIVERHDGHLRNASIRQRPFGKPRGNLFYFLFDILDGRQWILAVADDDDPTDYLRTALVQSTSAKRRTESDCRHIGNSDRYISRLLDDGHLDIREVFDESQPSDHVFGLVDLDGAGPDVDVRHPDGLKDVCERHAMGAHGVRIDVDLVFLDEPSDRGHFGDPIGREQRVADRPVLY